MRSLIILIFLILYLILSLPVLLIALLIQKKNEDLAFFVAYKCTCFALRGVMVLAGITLTVKGLENVPEEGTVLYIGNHRSYFDLVALEALCKYPTSFVAKKELKKVPLFGAWGRLLKILFFDRDSAKESVRMIHTGIDYLNSGTSVFIFPEGKRKMEGRETPLLEFHNGSFKMAVRTGVPIIPVAIKGAGDIWEQHIPWVKKGTIEITFGKPILYHSLSKEDQRNIGLFVQGIIENMLS